MKKYLALILALAMCFAFVACGGGKNDEVVEEDVVEEDVVEEDVVEEDVVEEDVVEEDVAEVSGDWYDFADIFTTTFLGVTESGQPVVFIMTADETVAALVVADTETYESVSFVGEMTSVDTGEGTRGFTITDENNGLALSFVATPYEDGIALDLGDLGAMVVVPCEQSEAFDVLNAVEIATIPVA